MRSNRSKDTGPELAVRRLLHGLGYRYRLHRRDLPGSPDIVFAARRKVVFVHGCFWHAHDDGVCRAASVPKTRSDFWRAKLSDNRERDSRHVAALEEGGWKVLIVWECWLRDVTKVATVLQTFLEGSPGA